MRVLMISALLLASGGVQAAKPSLDKELAGRTPGKAQACIQQSWIDQTDVFDDGSILYHMKAGPDYLNTPSPRCAALRSSAGLISRTTTGQLCSGDIVEVVDFASHFNYGSCGLGDFVPYPRVKRH